ncbi:hypothetical protein BC941DRAFT_468100 [Chlamydoabsidia padenii]|nr:hypothetical protein BC941DRAFT_468100 [Chlamydoabsidia padenii]
MSNSVADMQLFFMGLHDMDYTFSCKNADQLSTLWAVFTKCKRNIRDGFRLENMSWRLWYREAVMRKRLNTETTLVLPQPTCAQQQYTNNHTKQPRRLVRTRSLSYLSCPIQHNLTACTTPTCTDQSLCHIPNSKQSKFYIDQEEDDDEDILSWNGDSFDDSDDDTRFSYYSGYPSSSSSFSDPSLDLTKDDTVIINEPTSPVTRMLLYQNDIEMDGLRRSPCYTRLDQWFNSAISNPIQL